MDQIYADYENCTSISDSFIDIKEGSCTKFDFRESPYEINLKRGCYLVILAGAAGGLTTRRTNIQYGLGGISIGHINIQHERSFFLFIGGKGGNSSENNPGTPGYNGGAQGGKVKGADNDCASGGSGGATDMRLLNPDNYWNNEQGLRSRIIVAGGGGSGGCWFHAGAGGHGGGIKGENGHDNSNENEKSLAGGEGGSQRSGYSFGFGEKGEDGSAETNGESAGAGGGGYYGGFPGESGCNSCAGGGGGGGSSFISGHKGCYAIDEQGKPTNQSIHYSGLKFFNTLTIRGKNDGNGYALIIWESSFLYSCPCCLKKAIFPYEYFIILILI